MSTYKKLLTIPFFLTLFRFAVIPFLIIALLYHQWHWALCLFTLAAMSDILDGAFARLFNEETELGAYLDPLGDKILTLSTFGILAYGSSVAHVVPLWLFYLIFAKELLLIVAAAYLWKTKSNCVIHAGWAGKIAMFIQTTFIFIILLTLFAEYPIHNAQAILLMQSAVVVSLLIALLYYAYQAIRCKKSIAPLLVLMVFSPALDAKKSEFVLQKTVRQPKRSLNQIRQDSAEQLELLAHNLVHEIEAAGALLHDVMDTIRSCAEGDSRKGATAYLKQHQADCSETFESLDAETCARTAQLKAKHKWFEEAVISCNLNTSKKHESFSRETKK